MEIGDFKIINVDEDYFEIIGQNGQYCKLVGGDFESILSGMCAIFSEGCFKTSCDIVDK